MRIKIASATSRKKLFARNVTENILVNSRSKTSPMRRDKAEIADLERLVQRASNINVTKVSEAKRN